MPLKDIVARRAYNRVYRSQPKYRAYVKEYLRRKGDRHRSKRAWDKKRIQDLLLHIKFLKTRPCMDCGGSFDPVCMDFDHARGEKKFEICDFKHKPSSFKRMNEELKKCDLVCSNCHRIRTEKRRLERLGGE